MVLLALLTYIHTNQCSTPLHTRVYLEHHGPRYRAADAQAVMMCCQVAHLGMTVAAVIALATEWLMTVTI